MKETNHKLTALSSFLCIVTFVALSSMPGQPPKAESAFTFSQTVRANKIWIDTLRFPNGTVLYPLIDQAQGQIAHEYRAIEKSYALPVDSGRFSYPLPADFYLINTAILNAIENPFLGPPMGATGTAPKASALKFVPIEEYGKVFSFTTGRPTQFSVWSDTLLLDRPAATNLDTLAVKYWADPLTISGDSAAISIPTQFRSLLVKVVVDLCRDFLLGPAQTPPATIVNPASKVEALQTTRGSGENR